MTWQRHKRIADTLRRATNGIAVAAVLSTTVLSTADSASAQVATAGGSVGGAIQHNGQSFRVVRAGGVGAGGVETAASKTSRQRQTAASESQTIQRVGFIGDVLHGRQSSCDAGGCDGCSSCSGGAAAYTVGTYCGGSCGDSCGGTCGGAGQLNYLGCFPYGHFNGPLFDQCYNPCTNFNNPCAGQICLPYSYGGVEGLYFGRGGDGDAGFGGAPGGRITIGRLKDCAEGCEVVLTGLFEFEGDDPIQIPTGFATASQFAGEYESNFYSGEISRVRNVDDIARLRIGARYIRFDENIDDGVQSNVGIAPLPPINGGLAALGTGTFNNDVENNLVGGQVGLDLFYPISTRWYVDARGRAGAYINFAEVEGQIQQNLGSLSQAPSATVPNPNPIVPATDSVTANFSDDDEELAGVFEFGLGLRYLASSRLSAFARGEVWYITGVATSEQTTQNSINQGVSTSLDLDEDVIFFGVSGGFELKF